MAFNIVIIIIVIYLHPNIMTNVTIEIGSKAGQQGNKSCTKLIPARKI